MMVNVRVIPGSQRDEVVEEPDRMTVRTKAPAKDNKANLAAVKLLSNHFGGRVRLLSGATSRKKVFEITGP